MKYFNSKMSILSGVLILSIGACKTDNKKDLGNQTKQPILGYRSAKILKVEGFGFKDLNKDGQLNPYEDWRLSSKARSTDLLKRMSLEEKAGFMLISTTRLENDWSFSRPQNDKPITSGFNEVDQINETNIFTKKPLAYPTMTAAGTTKDVTQFHKRHFILRANPTVDILVNYTNNLQELCESNGHGIPGIITSNPRNHIAIDASIGLTVGKTPFTQWPGELGLAAMRDFDLTREFAEMSGEEWRSVGLRKGYMYMADLATDPRWQRVEGTFGEDAQLASKMMKEVILGFQGDSLSNTSVALTTKHFPGGGATEGGQDPHFDWGKREVFESDMFKNNLIPFKAAIEAGSSSIMPYYSYPVHTPYPEVGYAFNKEVLQGVLRGELGYKGIINSDTGPIDMMPWGVEELDFIERYKMALEAGVNLFSGTADPTKLIETLKKYPELSDYVDASVQLLLEEKFNLGLFENPYVDLNKAKEIVGNSNFKEKADLAMKKSIVLLRNDTESSNALPLKEKTKIYFETYLPKRGEDSSNVFKPENYTGNLQFVDTPEEADLVLLWLVPKGKSLFQSDGSPLHVNLSNNGIDTKYVNSLIAKKPTVLAINFTNPWAIDEIYSDGESGNVTSVLATFGTTPEAILAVVEGKFNPTGKMPFSTPVNDQAAIDQKSDLPGYMEGEGYALFNFDEGISYGE
ncbi:glycoside hydrolase family 3 N-terminal domain-containing protein [Cytophaga sp. FL35]|uniref:glycoside hydrolase family 3 protein n=1 Tax=Cytophaga sp. FL35 TaxID=1904456 RepID=UPI001653B355|nr:glycoside hydrolase family 3 N-terminal domain-containing protein [Cytophaga sp. FL35]MBC7000391.1 glycoside hydrolase family 3 C-terminal domain-containing protein [Cytophaga sp. FL35]